MKNSMFKKSNFQDAYLFKFGIIAFLFCIYFTGFSQSDGLPRGANEMPYERYESENASLSGGASIQGPTYDMLQLASEASDRRFVDMASPGSSVEWTVRANNQNGLTLRYTILDDLEGTLALYVNNIKVRDIELTSYWVWQYFDVSPSTSAKPFNTPTGSNPEPRMRFDELHFMLDTPLNEGDIIKLQNDGSNGAEYGVDFIELENVPDPIAIPDGFISVTDYGATPNDDTNDVLAFREAIDIANGDPSIRGVYVPAGRFIHGSGGATNGVLFIGNENFTFQGAGMWHTEIYFSETTADAAGILFNADAIKFSDMYLNTANNSRTPGNKAINGTVGKNSIFENIWMEHFETGFWITSIKNNGQWNVTDGLIIRNCRVRNIYADGTNLAKGTSNTLVEQVSYRNCVDDAMAVWSVNYLEEVPPNPGVGNIFRNNTVENNLRAAGIGFFGGHSHKADHLLIKDSFAGPGIRVNTQFPAYPFGSSSSQSIDISECTVIGSGTTKNLWTNRFGAIDLELANTSSPGQLYDLQYVNFSNIDVLNSQHDAVFIHSYMPNVNDKVLNEVYFNNVNIEETGVALDVNNGPQYTSGTGESGGHGYYASNFSPQNRLTGWVQLSGDGSFSAIAGEDIAYNNSQPEFEIRTGGTSNQAPSANAGDDQTVASTTTTVTLEGSGSDPEGQPITFAWSQNSGPSVTITSPSSATTDITGLVKNTTYRFLLTVSDGERFGTDIVTIRVEGDGTEPVYYTIQNVWQNFFIKDEGETVTYGNDASGIEYLWTLEDINGNKAIKNIGTGEYLSVTTNNNTVESTSNQPELLNSQWTITDTEEGGSVRIMSVFRNNEFLNVENLSSGVVEIGSIEPVWASAKWRLIENNTLAVDTFDTDKEKAISLYPNPASKQFEIKLPQDFNNKSSLAIYTFTGQLVLKSNTIKNGDSISIGDLSTGIYLVSITSNSINKTMQLLISH